jgi:hypothetical protein
MPAGKLKQVSKKDLETEGEFDDFLAHRDEDYETETTEESEDELPELKKKEKDPMDFPPDYTYLMKELENKGGIRFENCNEIEIMQSVIYENIKDESIRDNCLKILIQLVNFSNLWIIHYNKHKAL